MARQHERENEMLLGTLGNLTGATKNEKNSFTPPPQKLKKKKLNPSKLFISCIKFLYPK
jgi:hypothetical protein